MTLSEASALDENGARAHLERVRWPNGPICGHCDSKEVTRLAGKATRPGLFKCKTCRKQFRVEVGTIMEKSHLPLRKWLMAFAIMGDAKKGVSACQLQRELDLGSYEAAWFLLMRIRHVMRGEALKRLLKGDVQVDEVFIGKRGRGSYLDEKTPVVTLSERGGELRARVMEQVTSANMKEMLAANVDRSARLLTDEALYYKGPGKDFARHETVKHSLYEYARGDVTVNTCESFHGLLRRGIAGSFHHVSRKYLDLYVGSSRVDLQACKLEYSIVSPK